MRPRLVLIGVIFVTGLFVLGVLALHALIGQHDTWSAPVQAISTLALVAITGWYAYTTDKLVETQRSSHRRGAEESALRDLSRFISRQNEQVWRTQEFFPAGPPQNPPMLLDVFACRDAFKTLRNQLLEFVEITPREVAVPALGAAAHILNAEEELHALGAALTAETEAKYPDRPWTWEGAEAAHRAASSDEDWSEILAGSRVSTAIKRWEDLSDAVSAELRTIR
jgi:hypothetical protein